MQIFKSIINRSILISRNRVRLKLSYREVSFYERRKKLENALTSIIDKEDPSKEFLFVLPSSSKAYSSHHVPFPYNVNSYFYYYTGLDVPDSILVLRKLLNESVQSHIIIPEKSKHEELWEGKILSKSDVISISSPDFVHSRSALEPFINDQIKSLSDNCVVWFSTPKFLDILTAEHPADPKLMKTFQLALFEKGMNLTSCYDPKQIMDKMRVIKSDEEINYLKRATKITSLAILEAMKTKVNSEQLLALNLEYSVRYRGYKLGYPPIVAGADRGNIIHYLDNNRELNDGDLVLVDAGCKVNGYTSDITRTWPVNGRYNDAQATIQDILVLIQKECVSKASVEVSLQDLYNMMLNRIVHYLHEAKVIKSELKTMAVARAICPHHIGHYLGMDVHDTPTIPYTVKLQPGMVCPIEPGIYFPKDNPRVEGIAKEFQGLAVRLEDDFYMDDSGDFKKLCEILPSTSSDIASAVRGEYRNDLNLLQLNS